MVTVSTQPITRSRLTRFTLSFEYDKTLREIKQHVKLRTPTLS